MLLAQQYDLVLKGGHVIDPANSIDAVLDVAISGNKIAAVGPNLAGRRVVDVKGLYVVPGLVDLHAHVFGYEGSLPPDETSLVTGATTVIDAGGSGWRTFEEFRGAVIAHSKTRVLALLNIVGAGMVGEKAESNTADMEPTKTADMIQRHRDVIVGIKTAHFGGPGWTAIDRAVEAGSLASVPVMVDDKIFTNSGRTSRDKLLVHLRPGDIHTHVFNDRQLEVINRFTGKVQPYILEARQRGVLFDLGHGGGSFLWPVASKAAAQGFWPDTISTDLHTSSYMMQQSDMPNCMSKMMLLGMSLNDALLRSTVNPAKEIHRYPELGTLGTGKVADIAVLELQTGVFAFKDAWPAKRLATQRLQNVMTIRNGAVVYEPARVSSAPGEPVIYDVLLRNAQTGDVAITGKKIAHVGPGVRTVQARVVIDTSGYELQPGLTDSAYRGKPDYQMLPLGITSTGGAANRIAADAPANLALFDTQHGQRRCILTIREGKVVWDTEGLAITDWIKAGPYSNFK